MRSPVALVVALSLVACSAAPAAPAAVGATQTAVRATQTTARATQTAVPSRGAERYVAIGASDSVGVGAADPQSGSWPARVAGRLVTGSTYTNYGVSGSLLAQALREQAPAAISREPTLISVWLAVNDLNAGTEPAQYGASLDAILDLIVPRTRATIFVGNVPDLRAVPVYARLDPQVIAQGVSAFNTQITRSAARHPGRVIVVDLFTGSAELTSSATMSADGFHPSDRGYELIADRFIAAMRAAGIRLRD